MPSQDEFSDTTTEKEKGFLFVIVRCLFVLLFPIFGLLFFSFLIGFAALFLGNSSFPSPISVPSQCKIVSSSVDLRSSKVCELGLLNYKAKHVFYPSERKKFRCRYDYYWASIFKVEYKDHLSGQTRLGLAESPNEALPLDCRPTFGSAWLNKDKFKVNQSYDCWYTSGFSKVNLYQDNFFSCQAKDPSAFEMIKRYNILSTRILHSWFTSKGRAKFWRQETFTGLVTGFSTSLISMCLVKIMHHFKSWLPRISSVRMFPLAVYASRLRRTCLFIAYFSFMGWFAIQYGKRLGLLDYQY